MIIIEVDPKKVRVEDEMKNFNTAKIPRKFSVALQKARLKKGWKQVQLAQALNVKVTVINQYESGKAIPDGGLIAKMNRILNTKLPSIQKRGGGGNAIGGVKKKRKRPVKRNRKKKTSNTGGGN